MTVSEEIKGKKNEKECTAREKITLCSRRTLLKRAGWLGFFSVIGVWLVASVRFFFPRVLFEPSQIFKASFPNTYAKGEVSNKYQQSHGVFIIRTEEDFYALSARCTHLGCAVIWYEDGQKFKCPCHGSGFTKEGIDFEGPAPRPLERVKISLEENGQILINKSVVFRYERGEWQKPEAFLKL